MNPLPGFRDFYPETLAVRRYVFSKWRDAARRYGFREYDGPPLEPLELFTQKSGDEIVGQLFNFVDKGDRAVALRPEMTPTLARMVGAHHRDYKKPIKWFAIPQLFRYEKQQRGRLREHFQFNADIIGEGDDTADAELIALAIESLRSFGLTNDDFVVRISSREAWRQKFFALGLDEHQKQTAAFQAIDKLEREPREKTEEKLSGLSLTKGQIAEMLAFASPQATSSMHAGMASIQPVLNLLGTELQAFCRADFRIVRGLAYYTGIVWEIHDRKGELRAIAGGGRYDNLISLMTDGKLSLPAAGFGMGDVVLTELLKMRGLLKDVQLEPGLDCYVVITGGKAQKGNLVVNGSEETWRDQASFYIHQWRHKGLAIDYDLAGGNVTRHQQVAKEKGARFFLVFGPDEWSKGEVSVKDLLLGGEPSAVKVTEVVERLRTMTGQST
ncbi:MAG TPA: histidine--tRNA ligase [Verrucomicrobiae bacterium]|nr:histidine--tRNA ligase [Verrucomicrobiae bacterium]